VRAPCPRRPMDCLPAGGDSTLKIRRRPTKRESRPSGERPSPSAESPGPETAHG
jgi:hypothetical protein